MKRHRITIMSLLLASLLLILPAGFSTSWSYSIPFLDEFMGSGGAFRRAHYRNGNDAKVEI